jgi:hypothetical protein
MEHEFWKRLMSDSKQRARYIINRAMEQSGPDNVRRQTRSTQWPSKRSEPIFEKGKRFFLDVGGWHHDRLKGFSHTDFGLVSGKYILLCSWLNMEGETRGRKAYKRYCKKNNVVITDNEEGAFYFTRPIDEFFNMPKGAIVGHFESSEPLVSNNELIVFIPDLHLHLCRETVIDNFKYDSNFGFKKKEPRIISLEGELAELLKRAQNLNAEIIQVGDCFEVWEAQAHLVDDHMFLDEARKQVLFRLRKVWEKMWEEKKILLRDDYQHKIGDVQHRVREAQASGLLPPLTEAHVDQFGFPVDDTYTNPTAPKSQVDVIRERTMAKYPKIFDNEKLKTNEQNMPFLWLRGNHDNMRRNYYYEKVEDKDYKFECSRVIGKACANPELVSAYDIYAGGIKGRIWAEHGHRLDSVNADSVFDWDDKGYDATRFYTIGRLIGESGWLNGSIEIVIAETIGIDFYYMRGEQLNLVYNIFDDEAEVRVVVMGHTHTAALVDWGIFLREIKESPPIFKRA